MVSYSELIYYFTDIYLKTAMECSICKENYMMADDNKFLDDFMKYFSSLFLAVEQNDNLDINQLKKALYKKREETLAAFGLFMRQQILQQAVEYAGHQMQKSFRAQLDIKNNNDINMIQQYVDAIYDKESEMLGAEPVKLLKHIRDNEEKTKKKLENRK